MLHNERIEILVGKGGQWKYLQYRIGIKKKIERGWESRKTHASIDCHNFNAAMLSECFILHLWFQIITTFFSARKSAHNKMFTNLEKFGLVCISILGFQIFRFLFRTLYNNFLAVALRINAVDLKETGKWAGKYFFSNQKGFFRETRN